MLHSIFILSSSGVVLIEKHFRGTTSRTICDAFFAEVRKFGKREDVPPVITLSKYYLFSIYKNGLFFLANVSAEAPPLFVIEFLHRIFDVFSNYFDTVDESVVKRHFSTVYQLLEEMADDGLPLITEPNALHSLISPPSVGARLMQFVAGKSSVSDTIGAGAMSVIPWRKTDVRYAQNEIFFDIIEQLDCIIDTNGAVVRSDVFGRVNCKCAMSGTPDLTLVFNHPRLVEDAAFHPCVRHSMFERERVVSFIPPDGEFKMMEYRVPDAAHQSPLYLRPEVVYRDGVGTVTFTIAAKPMGYRREAFSSSSAASGGAGGGGVVPETAAEDISAEIRLPPATTVDWKPSTGRLSHDSKTKETTWFVGKLPRGEAVTLTATMTLPSGPPPVEGIAAELHFTVPGTTFSGLAVRDLKLVGETYKYYKGFRSMLQTGRYVVRA